MRFPKLGEPVTLPAELAAWPQRPSAVTAGGKLGVAPCVSIVTPSRNQAPFLEDALASVANQGYPDLEHLVIDGGSTDGTLALLVRHGGGVRWLSEPDLGQANALNKGFARARGEILGWLNADDYYQPGALHAVAAAFAADPAADVVYGDCYYLYEEGDEREVRLVRSRPFDLGYLINVGCFIHQPATFLRRRALTPGSLDESLRYAIDFDFWVRLARAGKRFLYVPATLATFRITEASKSGAELARFWPEVRRVSRRNGGVFFSPWYLRHWKERGAALSPRLWGLAKRAWHSVAPRA